MKTGVKNPPGIPYLLIVAGKNRLRATGNLNNDSRAFAPVLSGPVAPEVRSLELASIVREANERIFLC
jgi:hypothetical protein